MNNNPDWWTGITFFTKITHIYYKQCIFARHINKFNAHINGD